MAKFELPEGKWLGTASLFLPGFLWALLASLLSWVFFHIPLLLQGAIEKVTLTKELAIIWDIDNDSAFYKKMKGWYGNVVGCNITVVDYDRNNPEYKEHMDHEKKGHVYQNYIFGPLFYVLYVLFAVVIYYCFKTLHPYYDNPFERWARRVAGQKVEIPREEWTTKNQDRNPWW